MPILLFRVDERLIHGQVVMAWGGQFHPTRYIVVDDELVESEWEQELYRLAVPDDLDVVFADVGTARAALAEWRADPVRTILLTRDVEHMAALGAEGALAGVDINLGGLHHRTGRTEVRPYLFLDSHDRAAIEALVEQGATVSGRDLPDGLRVGFDQLRAEP